jgi:hypothetical protein
VEAYGSSFEKLLAEEKPPLKRRILSATKMKRDGLKIAIKANDSSMAPCTLGVDRKAFGSNCHD